MIEVQTLTFRYEGAERDALRDVNLTVPEGTFLGVIGPAGAGKTTLMRIMTDLLKPSEGRVLLDGREIAAMGAEIAGITNAVPASTNVLGKGSRIIIRGHVN